MLTELFSQVLSSPLSFKSLGVMFPAVCSEFVIPAKAGIQKTSLDSPASSAGQAKSSTE